MCKIKGFTLVELLVIFAVIALLLPVLMPAIANARKTASNVIYYPNEKELTQTWIIYADLNDGLPVGPSASRSSNAFDWVQSPQDAHDKFDTSCIESDWGVPQQECSAYGCWIDPVSVWHNYGSNFSFVDSHVEYRRWHDSRTINYSTKYSTDALVGLSWFRSDYQGDNVDLQWVTRRARAR
ncbi:MAG: type II secretion system protein [Planctomycetes bacterium]|nr:type II secretion system protein [Planctomycetota bacterium]